MGTVLDKASEAAPIPMPARPNFDLIDAQRNAPERPQNKTTDNNTNFIDFDLLVSDTHGALCKKLPVDGQIPVLSAYGDVNGCEYKDAQTDPHSFQIYNEHKDQTVKVYAAEDQGSGVMVGKSGDQCLILTANHVIAGLNPAQSLPPLRIEINGADFPTQVEAQDHKHDLAIITANMGSSGDALCKPVTIASADLPTFANTVTLGYPGASTKVYASPAQSLGISPMRDAYGENPDPSMFLPGEDPGRPMLEMSGLTIPGNSGGPTFDLNGNLVGVISKGTTSTSTIFSTPVTAEEIGAMMH